MPPLCKRAPSSHFLKICSALVRVLHFLFRGPFNGRHCKRRTVNRVALWCLLGQRVRRNKRAF